METEKERLYPLFCDEMKGNLAKLINSFKDDKGYFPEKLTREIKLNLSILPVFKKNPDFYENWAREQNEKRKEQDKEETDNKGDNVKFDFESIKPEKEIKTLDELKEVVIRYFPHIWNETKACLGTYATISLKRLNGCPSLDLVGSPSDEKTTVLSFFYGLDNSYLSDDFTPRAFVSHSTNVKKEELEEIDLLPKIQNHVLLTPELAPLFEAPKDKLIDNFATLTRVLDGEGLNRDTGAHGHRGYCGDYKFVWLGATTPLRASVWNIMGKIGNRKFFLNVSEKNRNNEDYLKMFSGISYEEKIKICRGAVKSFLENHFGKYPVREVEWNNKNDIFCLKEIIKYARFLSRLRATLMTWKSEDKGEYEYNFPLIEEPPRAINSLYNFAKGQALINDRNFLKSEDLDIVKRICFSSMPHDRHEFLKLLVKHEGRLTTDIISSELNCSQDTALRTMKVFEILGVVEIKNLPIGLGRPMNFIEIKPEFKELLYPIQVTNPAINDLPQENNPVFENYSNIKPEDFINNG